MKLSLPFFIVTFEKSLLKHIFSISKKSFPGKVSELEHFSRGKGDGGGGGIRGIFPFSDGRGRGLRLIFDNLRNSSFQDPCLSHLHPLDPRMAIVNLICEIEYNGFRGRYEHCTDNINLK